MLQQFTSSGMDRDRFPPRTSPNDGRSLPSIEFMLGEHLGARNNSNPRPLFAATPESDPRALGNLFKPSRSPEFPSWSSREPSRPSIQPRRREGLNHQLPHHYDHRRESPAGRSPGLGTFPQHLYPPKTVDYGSTRNSDSWYSEQRQVSSPRASGAPPVPGHVQQQQPQQAQQHLPPPQLNPINWASTANISNNNSGSGTAAAPGARPEQASYTRRLSPATQELDQCTSVNDSDVGTEKYSENGDSQSDFTSSIAEATYSRSGSVASPPRHFSCGRCKIGFKCDSLRR